MTANHKFTTSSKEVAGSESDKEELNLACPSIIAVLWHLSSVEERDLVLEVQHLDS